MTKQEIVKIIEQLLEMEPKSFYPDTPIIEDNYIFIPSVEFTRNSDTGEWTPIA